MTGFHGRDGVELVARDVRYARDDISILSSVDVVLRGGERVALTGPSGSGKSTLIALLAGFDRPDAGSVTLDGAALAETGRELRRRIGVVFQGYALVGLLTATENVELPLLGAGVASDAAARRAREALALTGLADRADHLVEELSGGQQQRLAVARALAARPDVLLVDEPTTEQDPDHRARTVAAVLDEAGRGAAVLLATHDEEVASRCDRWLHLEDGVLVEQA
ncbi:MAG TPA: ATP-binding cassette domain-containing protein [Marmoricola sp.]|nr:ATP-binding cassette domain-containing protein [Marmoricola sp.]